MDFLDDGLFHEILTHPQRFVEKIPHHFGPNQWVVADEIQRLPKVLNYVHKLIEERRIKFALTGSSARKLKRGGANLLAGRAFLNYIHPLTSRELDQDFDLDFVLNWGSLPKIFQFNTNLEQIEFLRSYTGSYLREEIKEEQIVRNLDPFARFLESAAQQNGKIINASKISRDSLTEVKSVQRYFDVLVDTYLGFYLEPYHRSVRKVQTVKSKFYFFDLGVKKALEGSLKSPYSPSSYAYGLAFEHFFILECMRLNDYLRYDDRFSYICTKDDVEIDLLIQRGRTELWAVEIKSGIRVDEVELSKKMKLAEDLKVTDFVVASQEPSARKMGRIEILPWQECLKKLYA